MKETDLDINIPASGYEVDHSPLQLPGRDPIIKKERVAGPETKQDIRVYYTRKELEFLLEMANASSSGRVMLVMAGLDVTTFQAKSGHMYQVWKVRCAQAKPENPAVLETLGITPGGG